MAQLKNHDWSTSKESAIKRYVRRIKEAPSHDNERITRRVDPRTGYIIEERR